MGFFLAIDGGGTKTQCWVADETRVLGQAFGGTVKLMSVDEATSSSRLKALVEAAAADARVPLAAITQTCIGLAGSSSRRVRASAQAALGELVGGPILLCGDEEIAFDAAFAGGPGVLVIAGTGSNVMGRCADGSLHNAGGWGPMLGDEGSGYWIGLQAIRASLRGLDRGAKTTLLQAIEQHWRLADHADLVAYAHQRERPAFGELAMVVARCAAEGDTLAADVLDRAGRHLAEQVNLVIGKMLRGGCRAEDCVRVAFTGSVLGRIDRVRHSMMLHLHASHPLMAVADRAVEPLDGALWLARRAARLQPVEPTATPRR